MYIYQKTINNSDCGKVTFRNSIHKMPDIFYFNFGNRRHVCDFTQTITVGQNQ